MDSTESFDSADRADYEWYFVRPQVCPQVGRLQSATVPLFPNPTPLWHHQAELLVDEEHCANSRWAVRLGADSVAAGAADFNEKSLESGIMLEGLA